MLAGYPIVIAIVALIIIILAVFASFRRKSNACLTRGKVEYIIDDDISNGRERHELPALSYMRHDETPLDFHYVTDHVKREPNIHVDTTLTSMVCCQCLDDCNNDDCICSKGTLCKRFYEPNGKLSADFKLEAPELIHECNMACKCNRKLCKNMVIQAGCQARLVLFRTKKRGWGVRTLDNLKRGTFVGVYSGELVSVVSSQQRADDTYLFNLSTTHTQTTVTNNNNTDSQQQEISEESADNQREIEEESVSETLQGNTQETNQETAEENDDHDAGQTATDGSLLSENSSVELEPQKKDDQQEERQQEQLDKQEEEGTQIGGNESEAAHECVTKKVVAVNNNFVCDAKFYGNFTRFINHSCEPNVVGIRTFTTHQDQRFPHISFFTNQDIPAGTELTLNYGDSYWLVKCKRDKIFCLCNRSKCRFNKKTLPITMKQHNQQMTAGS
uniref:Histone-lysine N-methyltransferase EHMT1 n=1 Tax=Aceria tosichella TaxID=561515 RepID=A0A6G1SJB3_9ACAR